MNHCLFLFIFHLILHVFHFTHEERGREGCRITYFLVDFLQFTRHRAGLRHLKEDRVKKFQYCLPCEWIHFPTFNSGFHMPCLLPLLLIILYDRFILIIASWKSFRFILSVSPVSFWCFLKYDTCTLTWSNYSICVTLSVLAGCIYPPMYFQNVLMCLGLRDTKKGADTFFFGGGVGWCVSKMGSCINSAKRNYISGQLGLQKTLPSCLCGFRTKIITKHIFSIKSTSGADLINSGMKESCRRRLSIHRWRLNLPGPFPFHFSGYCTGFLPT